jgi:hypothetical protein
VSRRHQQLARQVYPWGLLGGAVAWWTMLVGATWCAAKAILLAFAHAYANLDFHPLIPWLVLAQVVLYASLLWSLRRTFRRDLKPHLWQVYPTIVLTISASLSCFGVLAHNASRESAPPEARLWTGNLSANIFGPGGFGAPPPVPPGKIDDTPSVRPANTDKAANAAAPPSTPMRQLGFLCRDLAGTPLHFKILVALLALPVGMIVNRDLLRGHFDNLAPEGGLLVAIAWLAAILPALAIGWAYGYLVGWTTWTAFGNAIAIAAYRLAIGNAAPDGE